MSAKARDNKNRVSFLIKGLKISLPYRLDLWYINFFFAGVVIGKAGIRNQSKILHYGLLVCSIIVYCLCMTKWNRFMTLDMIFS